MDDDSAEQKARDMLERMGVEDAQSWSAGEVVELANLIRRGRCDARDAARYRWLRGTLRPGTFGDAEVTDAESWDAAIDKAMQEEC